MGRGGGALSTFSGQAFARGDGAGKVNDDLEAFPEDHSSKENRRRQLEPIRERHDPDSLFHPTLGHECEPALASRSTEEALH